MMSMDDDNHMIKQKEFNKTRSCYTVQPNKACIGLIICYISAHSFVLCYLNLNLQVHEIHALHGRWNEADLNRDNCKHPAPAVICSKTQVNVQRQHEWWSTGALQQRCCCLWPGSAVWRHGWASAVAVSRLYALIIEWAAYQLSRKADWE